MTDKTLQNKRTTKKAFLSCFSNRLIDYLIFPIFSFVSILFIPFLSVASDMNGEWVGDPKVVEMRLISAIRGTGDLKNLPLGMEFRLAPGWKIYWRSPGDAGLPPKIELKSIEGKVLTTLINWPVPKRFNSFGFDNFGYDNEVILPISVSGHQVASSAEIFGIIEALACNKICIPVYEKVGINIPKGPPFPSIAARQIAKFSSLVPRSLPSSHLKVLELSQQNQKLRVKFGGKKLGIDDIFVEGVKGVSFKRPIFDGDVAIIETDGISEINLKGKKLVLTIVAGEDFITENITVSDRPILEETRFSQGKSFKGSFWIVISVAFLGGLILNFMPCVLPVLAIKLASIIASSGIDRSLVRLRFISGACGIISSFLLLASVIALIRLTGGHIGWGVQFQSVSFLAISTLVIGLFGFIMLDYISIPVPNFVQTGAGSIFFKSSKQDAGPLVTDFAAGVFATLLATPCSAPFVGSAITAAFTGSIIQMFVIFFMMGLGLATPWLIFALFPNYVTFLPRSGRWMVWLKRFLASLLFLTVAWLGFLIFSLKGGVITIVTFTLVGLVIFSLLKANRAALILCLSVFFVFLGVIPSMNLISSEKKSSSTWEKWSLEAQESALAEGKLVLVDVTADWCITCKVNKTLVLDSPPLVNKLFGLYKEKKLVMLQADWTRPDKKILDFLASHGRYGIPFNVIYSPESKEGVILGELLTSEMVLNGLVKAGIRP